MTPTQRLAPMLRLSNVCTAMGMHHEARALLLVGLMLSQESNPVRMARNWAHVYLDDFNGSSPTGWAYAVAYVLLTEEAGQ